MNGICHAKVQLTEYSVGRTRALTKIFTSLFIVALLYPLELSASERMQGASIVRTVEVASATSVSTLPRRHLDRAALVAAGRPGVPLFFGYIEFDADPDAPGGVPGFGPLFGPHAGPGH